MFEQIFKPPTQVATQQQGSQDSYFDPYALPIDPYIARQPSTNWNMQMMLAVLDSKVKTGSEFDSYRELLILLVDNVGRIPNADKTDINWLNREMADILELSECDGTEQMVLSRMVKVLYRTRSLVSYGGSELRGLTGISAIITQRTQMEQQVKTPTEPIQQRKKIMGIL